MTGTSQVAELAGCRPGLELAGLLAGIDAALLTGKDAVAYAVAVQRQHNASCAARLVALLEVGLRARRSGDCVERMAEVDRYSADEVRAALALSLTTSQRDLSFAWAACRRIPEIHSAMASGHLDEQRAKAIVRWTEQLSDVHARSIAREVIPHCSALNPEP